MIERIHIKWQVENASLIIGYRAEREAVERNKLVDKFPDLLVACMENVWAVAMNMNPLDVFAIDITSNMRALVDDQTPLTMLFRQIGKNSVIQTGTY